MAGWLISNSAFATIFLVENGTGTSTWRAAGAGEVNVVLSGTSLNAWYTTATIAVGDQVWIKNGTYVLDGSITPKGGESIYGGFAGTETAITARAKGSNAWDFSNETVLDGNNAFAVIAGATSTTDATKLGGLTITKGTTSTFNTAGGALLKSNTTMENCVVTLSATTLANNQSAGGVFVFATAYLKNSLITYNTSANAAGGVNVLPGGEVDGCTIDHNTADKNAGGIYLIASSGGDGAKVSNCIITNNQAKGTAANTGNGGGLMIYQTNALNTPVTVSNCTISYNSTIATQGQGAGVMINEGGTTPPNNTYTFTNCTVSNNSAFKSGGGFNLKSTGIYYINNCKIEGNITATVSGGGLNVGGGTLTLNNTIFKNNNVGATTGGAINANPVGFTANNCLFYGNTGNSVIQFQSASSAFFTMNNCTVALNFNSDGTTAAGVNVNSDAACQITNSLFLGCGNTPIFVTSDKAQPNVNYCGFEAATETNVGAYTGKVGNIFSVSSATFQNAATDDFRLSSTSTAKDAGTTIAATSSDILGVSRPKGPKYDMGAYEYANTFTGTGNWSSTSNWTSGVLPNTTEEVIIGSGEVTIDQSVTVKSITINAGAKATVNTGITFTSTDFTINSDATNGTGTYVDKGTTTLTNVAKVNQYLTPYRSWYMSSPVLSATPTNMSSIRAYDDATYSWLTSTATMVAKKGYSVTPTSSSISNIQFAGSLNYGNLSIPIVSRTGTSNSPGFNLIGNPYPCYLDWNLVATVPANLAAMRSSTMWYRTKSSGGTYSFWTVNGAGVGSPSTASKDIPPMQAFWVRAVSGGGNLSLTTDMLSHGPETNKMLKAPSANKTEMTLIRLQVSNGTNTDEAVIYFNENSSNGLDAYDAPKMSNTNVEIPEIYSSVGNEQLVINGMNSIQLDTPIGIGFVPGNATSFSIKANEVSNLPSNVRMILKDNVTHIETDLSDGAAAYTFAPATTSADRFSVIFRSQGATTELSKLNENNYIVFSNNKKITLVSSNATLENAFVRVYNSVGQQVWVEKMTSNSMEMNREFSAGVYVVNINDVNKKVLVK